MEGRNHCTHAQHDEHNNHGEWREPHFISSYLYHCFFSFAIFAFVCFTALFSPGERD